MSAGDFAVRPLARKLGHNYVRQPPGLVIDHLGQGGLRFECGIPGAADVGVEALTGLVCETVGCAYFGVSARFVAPAL